MTSLLTAPASETPVRRIERRVVRRLCLALLKAGYTLGVYDGAEQVMSEARTWKAVEPALFSVDDEYLTVHNATGKRVGWVRLVYGNGGWDVICDYHIHLESIIAPVSDYADTLDLR